MAFPTTLYAYLESGIQVKITGAVRETRKPVITWDKEKYRDVPSLVVGGASGAQGDATSLQSVSVAGGVAPTVTFVRGDNNVYAIGGSSVSQEDGYTHVPKRNVPKLDELVEYWDSETVGDAMTMTVTTVSGSAIITVPDAQLLTPGQAIAGTGIPAGATILDILSESNGVITKTVAVMSHQATASAAVEATLTGGNRVGKYKESEFLGWGEEISTPM